MRKVILWEKVVLWKKVFLWDKFTLWEKVISSEKVVAWEKVVSWKSEKEWWLASVAIFFAAEITQVIDTQYRGSVVPPVMFMFVCCKLRWIHFANKDKYISQFGQINLKFKTNTHWNVDKYI